MQATDKMFYTSMFICDNFDVNTHTANNIINKINTNDNLSASFSMFMQIKCSEPALRKFDKLHCFLFLQNTSKLKLMLRFDVPNEGDNIKENTFLNYMRILEFDDYEFPDKGEYLWKLYVVKDEEYIQSIKPKCKDGSVLKLFRALNSEDHYLANISDLLVE